MRLVTPFRQRICVNCQTKPSSDEEQPNQTNTQGLCNTEETFVDMEEHFLVKLHVIAFMRKWTFYFLGFNNYQMEKSLQH
jgi:hypothetical protein